MSNGTKDNIIDTTDCLETVAVFKAAKNFFFIVCFLSLLVTQGIFWSNQIGLLDIAEPAVADVDDHSATPESTKLAAIDQTVREAVDAMNAEPADETAAAEKAETAVEGEADTAVKDNGAAIADTDESAGPGAVSKAVVTVKDYMFEPDWTLYTVILKLCNSILIFSALMYCLILLLILKVSLVGRLGGMAWISSAFIASLLFLMFLIPWQTIFTGLCIAGTIYTPSELVDWYTAKQNNGTAFTILFYLRFVMLWLITIIILVSAQLRSRRWAHGSLKRLGLVG